MSNFNMTKIDSKSQSAYYIAEAGINYLIDDIYTWVNNDENIDKNNKEEFFESLEEKFCSSEPMELEFKEYKGNSGIIPLAQVTVTRIAGDGEDTRDYKLESLGQIGKSKRKASAEISLTWPDEETDIGVDIDDVFIYSSSIPKLNVEEIDGKGSVVIDLPANDTDKIKLDVTGNTKLLVRNIYINGSINIKQGEIYGRSDDPGIIYINGDFTPEKGEFNGDVYVNGDFTPEGGKFNHNINNHNIYVNGDVYLKKFNKVDTIERVKYAGKLIDPENLPSSHEFIKVDKVEMPVLPSITYGLRENTWYKENGYEILNKSSQFVKSKLFVEGDFKAEASSFSSKEVVIVSTGNIELKGGMTDEMTGALIAPNGEVELNKDFTGLIIAKEIKLTGDDITMGKPSEIFGTENKDEWPFIVSVGNNNGGNNSGDDNNNGNNNSPGNNKIKLKITKPIREE